MRGEGGFWTSFPIRRRRQCTGSSAWGPASGVHARGDLNAFLAPPPPHPSPRARTCRSCCSRAALSSAAAAASDQIRAAAASVTSCCVRAGGLTTQAWHLVGEWEGVLVSGQRMGTLSRIERERLSSHGGENLLGFPTRIRRFPPSTGCTCTPTRWPLRPSNSPLPPLSLPLVQGDVQQDDVDAAAGLAGVVQAHMPQHSPFQVFALHAWDGVDGTTVRWGFMQRGEGGGFLSPVR